MSDQFSNFKTQHQSGFQQMSDKNFNLNSPPDFRVLGFRQPHPGNSHHHQHSISNIPLSNFSDTSSLSQLPQPPLALPPPPPQLYSDFNTNRFPSQNYTCPPPFNPPPQRFPPLITSEFGQPNIQTPNYSQPPSHFRFPPPPRPPPLPQNLVRQPDYELKQNQPLADPQPSAVTSKNKNDNMSDERIPAYWEDKDKIWIKNWTTKVKKRLSAEQTVRNAKKIKINEVQKKLLSYASLLKELKEILTTLSPNSEVVMQGENTEIVLERAHKLKVKIEALRDYFSEEEVKERIKECLKNRREKRIKRRKTKQERNAKKRRRKEEWKKMEEEMDDVIRRANEEEKQKLEEEKMKREADSILREVRAKQEDVVRMGKLLQALDDLRNIRKKKGEIHGYVENSKASVFFDKMKKEFETVLSDQEKIYRAEEQTLKIMIEESQSSSGFSKKFLRPQLSAQNLNQVKKDLYQIYFGRKKERSEVEREYERSFLAAEESVEILVQRRKDWDQFIVSDDNSGSSVPLGWVLPNSNPNDEWRTLQES